jgi:hypothetical protein
VAALYVGRKRMTSPKANRAAEIRDAIRQALFRDWDPIGVNDNPNLQDEYDSYIAPVYRILSCSRSEQELVDFLFRTEGESVGLQCDLPERLRPIARKLLELDIAI